tara:strand:+ start:43301 stop:43609 length:309 start_codon:yes stop_codon:yes gene_type:complete
MLGLLAITTLGPLAEFGVLGIFLGMVWVLMVKKDKKSYEMIDAQNVERKAMYESHSELIKEVTSALVDKNNTDDKMAAAVSKLADELRDLRHASKRNPNEEA